MLLVWDKIVELIGDENAEKLRVEFRGEEIRIPVHPPKETLVPRIKEDLKNGTYEEIAKRYSLSVKTVRRYEKWKVKDGRLISPSGREYLLPI